MPRRIKMVRVVFLLALVAGFSLFFAAKPSTATAAVGVNQQISFQGKVVKADGTNIADGTYNMEFKIYQDGTSTSGGTLKWTEDRLISSSAGVTITSGTFQVNLGSIASLSGVDFNQNTLWLSMQVGSTSSCTVTTTFQANCSGDGEMSPYIRMTATPYALNADKLDGVDSTGFASLTPSGAQTGSINVTGSIQAATITASSQIKTGTLAATSFGGTITTTASTLQHAVAGNLVIDLNDSAANSLVVQNTGSGAVSNINIYNGSLTTGSTPTTRIDASGNFTALGLTTSGNTLLQPTSGSATALVVNAPGPLAVFTADTLNKQVIVGSAITDANQINLQFDSSNVFAETATCSTTTNQGAQYYNTAVGSMRGCINGNWEDMVSTGGLGLLAYGVLPDSANSGNIGELSGLTQTTSPCKVYWASATSVMVAPCYAYSGGRKVQVTGATAISTASVAASAYVNICLTGTNNQPALVGTGNATETAAGLPTWNANNPVLCLATLQMSTTAGTITGGKIFDIRTFTTTQKTFATLNAAMALGTAPVQSSTPGVLAAPAVNAGLIRGIIVASSGSASSTAANVILATAGPQWVKASGTSTVVQYGLVGATNGYSSSVTSASTVGYANLGVDTRTIDTTCTSNATCQYSQFFNPLVLR